MRSKLLHLKDYRAQKKGVFDMSNAVAIQSQKAIDPKIAEQIILNGDLSNLSPQERVVYYNYVCESLGLNWLTKPFDLIKLNGKLVMYAKKDCTDQLSRIHKLSREVVSTKIDGGCYIVVARAKTLDGRFEDATGIVWIEGLKGEAKANAMLKAETKAKRRSVLSIQGLGFNDETEVETIPGAERVELEVPSESKLSAAAPSVPSAASGDSLKISQGQLKRLFTIAKSFGIIDKESLKKQIKDMIGYEGSLTELSVKDYDFICEELGKISAEIDAALGALDEPPFDDSSSLSAAQIPLEEEKPIQWFKDPKLVK
jgi:hypothetical protein